MTPPTIAALATLCGLVATALWPEAAGYIALAVLAAWVGAGMTKKGKRR